MALTAVEVGFFGSTTGSTSTPVTLTAGITIGHVSMVVAKGRVTAISDSRGNTYTKQVEFERAGGGDNVTIWTAPVTTALLAADVVTITTSNSIERLAIVLDCAGITAAVDATGTGTWDWSTGFGTQAWTSVGSFTPAAANELILEVLLGPAAIPNFSFDATDQGGVAFSVSNHANSGGSFRLEAAWAARNASGAETPSGVVTDPAFAKAELIMASFPPAPVVKTPPSQLTAMNAMQAVQRAAVM